MSTTPALRLGPLLRQIDDAGGGGGRATIWVETDGPREVEVRCADGAGGRTKTFRIAGHHYAMTTVTGLTPGTVTPYEVLLDGARVWPPAGSPFPPSTIAVPATHRRDTVRVAFGSCRWAAPAAGEHDPAGPDALGALATRLATDPAAERPDVLLLLGDQVYADEVSPATREWLARRRDLNEPPGPQVTDYEEYTRLYDESWSDPEVRWLLSTVPSLMIFDDHDLIDDWNTSAAWLAEIRATPWWRERVLSGLMSYWVYQHLGNLSPGELESDPLFAAVRAAPDTAEDDTAEDDTTGTGTMDTGTTGTGTAALRAFAERADADPTAVRWSYARDIGRTRVIMIDTRAARVLEESRRAMLAPAEAAWVRERALADRGAVDHLLIGTSLPWLLPPLVHDAEGWDAALCAGARGARLAALGERVRRAVDLEHWAAFPDSFAWLAALIAEAGRGEGAPATVLVLSGDVHHAYVAEPRWPDGGPEATVLQLTCSPVHNSIPRVFRWAFRFGWTGPARLLGRVLAWHGRTGRPPVRWDLTGGPWFGNQLMTLTLRGRAATLALERAEAPSEPPAGPPPATPAPTARLVMTEVREVGAGGAPDTSDR
ncbi:alkaline phosphatase D family protein [Streptomyces sp. NPDC057638]|uniref:alkaline phosphatase D family protein n=1 Tax=Streptomyces sp. NPDC057638 TaxID=3346190 RepID=UPI00369472B5